MIKQNSTNLIFIKNFWFKQFTEIKKKGINILFLKLITLFKISLIFIPALFFVILVRLSSPFVIIKFKSLDMARMGEQTLTWYLKLKKIGAFNKKREFNFFYINNSVNYVNIQWLKMWRKNFNIFPSFIFKYVDLLNSSIPGHEKYSFPPLQLFHRQLVGREKTDDYLSEPRVFINQQTFFKNLDYLSFKKVLEVHEPLISFNKKDLETGQKYLKKIGTEEKKFICFNARDKKFLNEFNKKINWNYQNFRNSDIISYLPAIEKMTQKNLHCIRTGFVVENTLETKNNKIIDYANSKDRSDLLDIYLGSKCLFYLLSGSGISGIPQAFNKPIVFVNHHNINEILAFTHNSLYIPKKYYLIDEKRFLRFDEFIDLERKTNFTRNLNFDSTLKNKIFVKHGLEIIDNSAEEISDVVVEMEKRISGTWETDEEETELQNKFWSLFNNKLSLYKNINYLKSPTFRIGSIFLKKNKNLILR